MRINSGPVPANSVWAPFIYLSKSFSCIFIRQATFTITETVLICATRFSDKIEHLESVDSTGCGIVIQQSPSLRGDFLLRGK